ncbi:MAG: ATP synthase F1 subunit delta [Flavobacteriaceae bacterium]|nr:ATP synthase F1 subunit delta [Flavobacteriaceae bacterium]
MSGSRAAKRYAKAVLLQATDVNLASVVFDDMQTISTTISESNELNEMLQSPVYKDEDKKEALIKIFVNQSDTTKSLISTLITNKRASLLNDVASSYIDLYKESQGIKVAQVTTAIPLTSELETKVLAKVKELTGSDKVTLESSIDESIIGGFILRIGDLQYNASISNSLAKIKREFSKSI